MRKGYKGVCIANRCQQYIIWVCQSISNSWAFANLRVNILFFLNHEIWEIVALFSEPSPVILEHTVLDVPMFSLCFDPTLTHSKPPISPPAFLPPSESSNASIDAGLAAPMGPQHSATSPRSPGKSHDFPWEIPLGALGAPHGNIIGKNGTVARGVFF